MKTALTLLLISLSFSAFAALPERYLVVPNRSDSSITILSTPDGRILQKITENETGFKFEPIYASALPNYNMVAVSDRMNSQLMFFDISTFQLLKTIPTSKGMFHMWPTPEQKEIFAVADIDDVVNAVEINRFGNQVVYRKRLIDVGKHFNTGHPHDVVVDKRYVFVTVLGVEENNTKVDYVLKYDRKYLQLRGYLKFSEDIHLGLPQLSRYLLVPEQTDGQLNFVNKESFKVEYTVNGVPGAHGIYQNPDASRVFLANFTSTGPMSIYEVRLAQGSGFAATKVSEASLPDAKAHNITVDFYNSRMFVTHSGPNNDGELNTNVAIFDINGTPKYIKSVKTGVNPLGILLVEQN